MLICGRKWGEVVNIGRPKASIYMAQQGTTVYSGSFRHSLDDKNRITIPSAWRYVHAEGDEFLAVPQDDKSIVVVPPATLGDIHAKAAAIPISNIKAQQVMTRFFEKALRFSFDKQGRMMLTEALRKHAGIGEDAVLVGAGGRFVIYNPERWEQIRTPEDDDNAVLAQLGI